MVEESGNRGLESSLGSGVCGDGAGTQVHARQVSIHGKTWTKSVYPRTRVTARGWMFGHEM